MYYVLTLYKKDMAEAKLGWILFNLLGIPVTLYAFLADNIPSLYVGEPYHSIMAALGILFMSVTLLRAYQRYRKERIANDKAQHELNEMKNKK